MSDSAAPAPATIPLLHRTVPHAALRLGVIGTLAFLLMRTFQIIGYVK